MIFELGMRILIQAIERYREFENLNLNLNFGLAGFQDSVIVIRGGESYRSTSKFLAWFAVEAVAAEWV